MERAGKIKYKSLDHLKFYRDQVSYYAERKVDVKQKINLLAWLRVFVFILIVGIPLLFWSAIEWRAIGISIGLLVLFIALVKKHESLKRKTVYYSRLIRLNTIEVDARFQNFKQLESGLQFLNSDHPFSLDLDLFGEGSLFQSITRPGTLGGKEELAHLLLNPILDKNKLFLQQEAVNELTADIDFRQDFWASAHSIDSEKNARSLLLSWRDRCFKSNRLRIWGIRFYTLISSLLLVAYSFKQLEISLLISWLAVGLLITGVFLKRTTRFHSHIDKLKESLGCYYRLLVLIESKAFRSQTLKKIQPNLSHHGEVASEAIGRLVRLIERFDYRNNIIVGILLNSFALYDFLIIEKIDAWLNDNAPHFKEWLDSIALMDANLCIANYAFNHPGYSFPTISVDCVISAKEMGHPLIPSFERITNDFELKDNGRLAIITGANMSGKSTFLRTVGVNLVLAGAGAPVCAKTFEYVPMLLFTNMRTTDSLTKHESYFYAELKRLKTIVDILRENKPVFLIIDEMLKGTNSKDKAFGSMELVRQFAGLSAFGLIATHDLELGELSKEMPLVVINRCFEVVHDTDNIVFDYKLREGVTTIHNATFLMKKMGIIPEITF